MSEQPATRRPRFDRLPRDGERNGPFSRGFYYKLHKKYGGVLKKVDGATVKDNDRIDEIIASAPDVKAKARA
jgi:hypothetical protein